MKRGRPKKYEDTARVCIRSKGRTRLQANSDRRAIVQFLVDRGGCATLGEIDTHFGFSIRSVVLALEKAGWVEVTE